MTEHILKDKLSIDVDDAIGLGNLAGIRIENRPILGAFFEPVGAGGDAPRGTVTNLDTWRGFGGGRIAGLRFVPHNWSGFTGLTGSQAAKKASDYIAALEKDGVRRVDAVEWDIETHDVAWQTEFLLGTRIEDDSDSWTKGIRGRGGLLPNPKFPDTLGYRWGRPGVWTMEGRQGTNTSVAHLAAATGLLVGPQLYPGPMTENWSWHYELRTWVLNSNPDKAGAHIPLDKMIPYTDAAHALRISGDNEAVLFATSRLS